MQTRIPCMLMRGGTSKGAFFRAEHLPADVALRDRVLLAVMGSPDLRQIDGLGGADPLTSKVAIVSRSTRPGVDLDYLFAQVMVNEARVDTTPNCGNMLAGVVPFAVETGMIAGRDPRTTQRVLTVNTGVLADIAVCTPGGSMNYQGDVRIDGVPGTSTAIAIDFLDVAGSSCGALLPTGRVRDVVEGLPVTCIDNGMPVVLVPAEALGRTGYETRQELNADTALKARLEAIRLAVGPLMNLGDVTHKVVPKMTLVARPRAGGSICTRSFIPHDCHASIGVLAAVTVAAACVLSGSVAAPLSTLPPGMTKRVSVEHPTGEFTVELELAGSEAAPTVRRSALLRTARPIMDGRVLIPRSVWDGVAAKAAPAYA